MTQNFLILPTNNHKPEDIKWKFYLQIFTFEGLKLRHVWHFKRNCHHLLSHILKSAETQHTRSSLRLRTVGSMVTSLVVAISASIAFSWMLVKTCDSKRQEQKSILMVSCMTSLCHLFHYDFYHWCLTHLHNLPDETVEEAHELRAWEFNFLF